jgi:hypothetical protein
MGASTLFLPSLFGRGGRARAGPNSPPPRLVIVHSSHGQFYNNWRMRAGAPNVPDFGPMDWEVSLGPLAQTDFSPTLAPFYALRNQMLIVDGIAMHTSYTDPLDANGHQTGTLNSLTGARMKSTTDNTSTAASIDQIVAAQIARTGSLRSVEMQTAGGSDDNYLGCIRDAMGNPILPEGDSVALYNRMFPASTAPSSGPPTDAQLFAAARSAAVGLQMSEFGSLAQKMSGADQQKLQAHQDLLSDLKAQLSGSLAGSTQCTYPATPTEDDSSTTADFNEKVLLTANALLCDITRVVTIQHGGPQLAEIGEPPGDFHQQYAHHCEDGLQIRCCALDATVPTDPTAQRVATEYHTFDANLVAGLASALQQLPESDGSTVLDNTIIVWCGELATGSHDYAIWPVVILGGSALGLKLGRNVYYGQNVPTSSGNAGGPTMLGPPHNKLWVSVANALGVSLNQVGLASVSRNGNTIDCTGPLPRITST